MTEETNPPLPSIQPPPPNSPPPAPPTPPVVVPPMPKTPLQAGGSIEAFYPKSVDEALRYAQIILTSGAFPESIKKKTKDEQVATIVGTMFKGMEVGLPPMAAVAGIMEVNGRYSVWGDAGLGLIQKSGKYEWHDESIEGKPMTPEWKATCTFKRKGNDKLITRSFTWAQATAAGLIAKYGSLWTKYPERMMQMRARAWAMRDGFSDVLLGLSIAEEVRDFEVSTPAAAPPVETQQDAFTMKALENKPAAPVDFGLMGSKPMQAGLAAVEKSDGKVVPMAAEKVDPQPDLLGLPPLPEEKSPEPPCQTCGGYGVNPADETMDCPDCIPTTT